MYICVCVEDTYICAYVCVCIWYDRDLHICKISLGIDMFGFAIRALLSMLLIALYTDTRICAGRWFYAWKAVPMLFLLKQNG